MKLIPQLRMAIRAKHYSMSTEKTYVHWTLRFIRFHGIQHPKELFEPDVVRFLEHLVVDGNVAASTQNQALCALVFLYREVVARPLGSLGPFKFAERPATLPLVLARRDVDAIIEKLRAPYRLMGQLMYGAGLRVGEAVAMRVQDIDFGRNAIAIRHGKGAKDRMTLLPLAVRPALTRHVELARVRLQEDTEAGFRGSTLPNAFDRKATGAHDRAGLERLCRYMARPPIPQDRLEWRQDGTLVLSLKRTWKGGVRAIVFKPLALIARLAALVPAPYVHLRRFYGIFGPHHALRSRILPTPPGPETADNPVAPKRPKSMSWADLLMRVWRIDALVCPHCGARMRIVGAVRDPDAITAILAAIHCDRWTETARGPPETTARHEQAA